MKINNTKTNNNKYIKNFIIKIPKIINLQHNN